MQGGDSHCFNRNMTSDGSTRVTGIERSRCMKITSSGETIIVINSCIFCFDTPGLNQKRFIISKLFYTRWFELFKQLISLLEQIMPSDWKWNRSASTISHALSVYSNSRWEFRIHSLLSQEQTLEPSGAFQHLKRVSSLRGS